MNLQGIVKGLLPVVAPVAMFYTGCTGLNFHQNHNVKYLTTDGALTCSKADGVFTSTEVEISKDGSVKIARFLPLRIYSDNNGDGKVDRIYQKVSVFLGRGRHAEEFVRDQHLEQYPLVFQEADKDFNQQRERFKDLCKW